MSKGQENRVLKQWKLHNFGRMLMLSAFPTRIPKGAIGKYVDSKSFKIILPTALCL